jgi:predicted regulator of amino acid metabolism with ACT domain
MQTLTLDKYIVKIISENSINVENMISMLNEQIYPRGIMEALQVIRGISKIEIYSIDTKELLLSTTILS